MTKAATYYFPCWPSGCNDCDELDINPTSPVYEPGAGYSGEYNFGYNTSTNDDSGTPYIDDYFIDLCGPGAADVTLWYWPYPNNTMNTYTTEPLEGAKTTWDGTDPYDGVRRMRGYMMQLAYNINPGWTYNGMQRSDPHWDATEDWAMRQGLNWEASNHAGTSYFYISDTPDSSKNIKLLANVTDDIKDSNVPVVVLMNARYLPNWSSSGNPVGHYITIVGYNNDTSQYAYVDTCGYWTYCNHNGTNTDGGVHVVDQNTLFSGILSYGNEWFW
jgi:hypothetical protein